MFALLLAADEPRQNSRVNVVSRQPALRGKTERCAWLLAEYCAATRRPAGTERRAMIARDLAAAAFDISLHDLCGPSRTGPIAKKRGRVMCAMRLLSGASFRTIGALCGRKGKSAYVALSQHAADLATLLDVA